MKPTVLITHEALATIQALVHISDVECSMIGRVQSSNNGFLIDKIYIPKQTRSPAFTKITEEGVMELLSENQEETHLMKAWFHSHVNMGVTPSGTDEEQAKELMNDSEWFIRGIFNKKGEYSLSIHWKGFDIEAELKTVPVEIDTATLKATLEKQTVVEPTTFNYPYVSQDKNKTNDIFTSMLKWPTAAAVKSAYKHSRYMPLEVILVLQQFQFVISNNGGCDPIEYIQQQTIQQYNDADKYPYDESLEFDWLAMEYLNFILSIAPPALEKAIHKTLTKLHITI